jgi:hypothetical protein
MRDQMMPPRFLCSATLISAGGVIAALGGCSGSPAPIPQSQLSASAHNVRQGVDRAWAAAGLGPQNLIYVSNSDGLVNVYHYWQRTLVGVLTDFKQPMGMCVDNEQNVYITDYGAETIVEYPHGGTTPIQTINDARTARITAPLRYSRRQLQRAWKELILQRIRQPRDLQAR